MATCVIIVVENVDSLEPNFEYHMSMFPSWAQGEAPGEISSVEGVSGAPQVEGKWAEVGHIA